mmetsp:Transcript_20004/g.60323  ORF Transcript_20004/g.60323 Transcript_20004/m.60323 type:complete len:366 (+) Transcript_20004:867-1964(+)
MSRAGNFRSYCRAAFGDHGRVADFEGSKSERAVRDKSPPAPRVPDGSAAWVEPGEIGGREGEDGALPGGDGERLGLDIDRGGLEAGDRVRGESSRAFGDPGPPPVFEPSHAAARSGGDTPSRSPKRSSRTITCWKRRARSVLKSFFALHLWSKPNSSHERMKSSSLTRPIPSGSRPLRQAARMEPKRPTSRSRASSSMVWASGSMSSKAILALFCGCLRSSSSQMAFRFPLKAHSSKTRQNLPKAAVPTDPGSSANRHATTVDPYVCLRARRRISSRGSCASMSLVSTLAAVRKAADGRMVSSPLLLLKWLLWPGFDSASFGIAMNAGSPRCLLRVQLGSRSQMVINCRPGTGCKHLKSFPTSWG